MLYEEQVGASCPHVTSLSSSHQASVSSSSHQTTSPPSLLQATVTMKYLEGSPEKTVEEVIQWMMQSLASGIDFDEWGAPTIDISVPS